MHSTGDLSYRGVKTGVVYGALNDVMQLRQRFQADHTIFCFDSRESKRKEIFPDYKSNRYKKDVATPEEQIAWEELHRQMLDLRLKYLSWAGFPNLFVKNGYEADDIAGSIVMNNVTPNDNVTLITGDKDFYQLIRSNVMMFNATHKKRITLQSFFAEWKFSPPYWAELLSICGCDTDTVPGIHGVGPVNAAKFIRGELNDIPAHMHLAIDSRKGREIRARNMRLVRLPFDATPHFELKKDKFDLKGWRKVCEELGARSLQQYQQ